MPLPKISAVLLGLLACNTVYYILSGRFSEALESVAWYALLILFVLEITRPRLAASAMARKMMRLGRLMATLAIAASAVLYAREREWLDAANLLLWIAVVVLLEIEVQRPAAVAAHPKAYARTAVVLYAALASLVVVWLINGKWMNAWDATVWLAAFGLLELNMLQQAENLFNKNR